jgi:hypothetical protein
MKNWEAPKGYPNSFVVAANCRFELTNGTATMPDYFQGIEQVEESLVKQEFTKIVSGDEEVKQEQRIEDTQTLQSEPSDDEQDPSQTEMFPEEPHEQD